jgi:transcriptional regulator with XRE-family HTH domain
LAREPRSPAFARWLNERLAEAGISRYRLAAEVGVTSHAVFKWLRGESVPVRANCEALAAYFGVAPEEVFGVAGWKTW